MQGPSPSPSLVADLRTTMFSDRPQNMHTRYRQLCSGTAGVAFMLHFLTLQQDSDLPAETHYTISMITPTLDTVTSKDYLHCFGE